MDKREILRLKLKYEKFLDPIVLLGIICIFMITILSVLNLSPQTYQGQNLKVLGVINESQSIHIEPVYGDHKYIEEEELKQISEDHFKYTALIKKNSQARVSKPIIHIVQNEEHKNLRAKLIYTNTRTPRISLVNENVSYILQEEETKYSQKINLKDKTSTLYLAIENNTPIFFDQYIEIHLFPEK